MLWALFFSSLFLVLRRCRNERVQHAVARVDARMSAWRLCLTRGAAGD